MAYAFRWVVLLAVPNLQGFLEPKRTGRRASQPQRRLRIEIGGCVRYVALFLLVGCVSETPANLVGIPAKPDTVGIDGANTCDDNDPCTDDWSSEGICLHKVNDAPCNDGSVCTVDDVCSNDKCSGSPVVFCKDDGDPCTVEACDPKLGCVAPPLSPEACACKKACEIGAGGTCTDGKCVISGNGKGKGVTCPPGMPCKVIGTYDTTSIDCGSATTCEVLCGNSGGSQCKGPIKCGPGSCTVLCGNGGGGSNCAGQITCGTGPCKVQCGGNGGGSNCDGGIDCGSSCACEVTCGSGCSASTVTCSAGCSSGAKSCTTAGACNTCN